MPVVEMHDLRREPHALAADERRVRQQQEAPMLVGIEVYRASRGGTRPDSPPGRRMRSEPGSRAVSTEKS